MLKIILYYYESLIFDHPTLTCNYDYLLGKGNWNRLTSCPLLLKHHEGGLYLKGDVRTEDSEEGMAFPLFSCNDGGYSLPSDPPGTPSDPLPGWGRRMAWGPRQSSSREEKGK